MALAGISLFGDHVYLDYLYALLLFHCHRLYFSANDGNQSQ